MAILDFFTKTCTSDRDLKLGPIPIVQYQTQHQKTKIDRLVFNEKKVQAPLIIGGSMKKGLDLKDVRGPQKIELDLFVNLSEE